MSGTAEERACRKGLQALYLEAPEAVVRDMTALVEAATTAAEREARPYARCWRPSHDVAPDI